MGKPPADIKEFYNRFNTAEPKKDGEEDDEEDGKKDKKKKKGEKKKMIYSIQYLHYKKLWGFHLTPKGLKGI